MPKFLVVIQDFGTEEPELKVVKGNSYDEVFDDYEHNQRNLIVVELTTEVKATLKKAISET